MITKFARLEFEHFAKSFAKPSKSDFLRIHHNVIKLQNIM